VTQPFKIGTSEIDFVKLYISNRKFRVVKNPQDVFIFQDLPIFEAEIAPSQIIDPFYRSVFGPAFTHDGRIYARSDLNLSAAATRLFAARLETNGLTHWDLRQNQEIFVHRHKKILTDFGHMLCQNVHEEVHNVIDQAYELVSRPHQKKRLRIRALTDLLEGNKIFSETWMQSTAGNVKGEEWAKPGKYPRLVNDLTTPASLLGGVATSVLKDLLSQESFKYKGGEAIFVKSPDSEKLGLAFTTLIKSSHPVFLYFSDDSVLGITIDGTRRFYNIDIATADGSHTKSAFDCLTMLSRGCLRTTLRRLVRQCQTNLVLKTRKTKKRVEFKVSEPTLYSGSTLTTLVNNVANLLIFMSVMDVEIGGENDIMAAAAVSGYNVTIDTCNSIEQIQFLKHSPHPLNDSFFPVINIGVILRLSGVCKRDVPGSKRIPLGKRCNNFQKSLMNCFNTAPRQEIVDILTPPGDLIKDFRSGHYIVDTMKIGPIRHHVEVSHYFNRYGLTESHMKELYSFASHGLSHLIKCHASIVILQKDYGLGPAILL
jgi:hypothetical protein